MKKSTSGEDIGTQFNLATKSYDENRKKFIPCFDDCYISCTDFIARTLKNLQN